MDIALFKDKLFEKALKTGFEDCEIYYSGSDSLKISVYKGEVEKFQNRSSSGFGFRGIYNGKMGYYFSEKIDEAIIDSVIKNAKENAEILDTEENVFIFEGSDKYENVKVYNESINKLTVEDKIAMAVEAEKTALGYSDKIKSVNTSMVTTGEASIYIVNTKGLELNEKSNYFMCYIEVMAEYNGSIKEKGEIYLASPDKFNTEEFAQRACIKAISALGGESLPSGRTKVVVKNEAFADLMSCFAGNFYAENVQKGFSLLKNKIGQRVAADIVTITDNPLVENGYMTTAFDSEGVASYNKNVIEKGILKTYLYNLKSANKDGVKSTGNGFKASFKGAVSTAHTNFYIEKGVYSFEELIKNIYNGLLITDVTGLHAGANSISGDFSLAAEGFKIENGCITSPVEQITAAGNFYNVLNGITAIGNDLKFNTDAVGSPSIAAELDISGL